MLLKSEATSLAGASEGLIKYFESRGLARDAMLKASGLTQQMLKDPDARIPATHGWRLWRYASGQLDDPDLGLACAHQVLARSLGLVGYTMMFSHTVAQALKRLVRYSRILSETLRYRLEEKGGQCVLALEREPRLDVLRHPVDLRLAGVLAVLSEITGAPITPVEIHFSYSRPASTAGLSRSYRGAFFFGAKESHIVLRRTDMDRPVQAADTRLAGYLDDLASRSLQKLGGEGAMSARVQRSVWSDLSDGVPALARVASNLGVSARTLQRKLEMERTSYSAVVESLRREMAQSLLENRELAIYQVGFLLGYADPAAFHRAFRRWTSRSPRQFRKEAATG